jgi:glycosyltransferase involved in cell wall biosynthesis
LLSLTASINPLIICPAQAAQAIISRTEDSKNIFPRNFQHKITVMLETGISGEILRKYKPLTFEKNPVEIRAVYSGRLVSFKNVKSALLALAAIQPTHPHVCLTIVGDGPQRNSLQTLTTRLGLQSRVNFMGSVSQFDAIQVLQKSHIFFFPSLREGGTWSLIEAMAVGLPVICMDTTGMHVITDESCALRIPPTSPEDTVNRMAEALVKLADSAELRRSLGENGRRRIEQNFLWSQKGEFVAALMSELQI